MKVSEDIDVQMLNEFKQGRLEMLYRRLYPALLLYAVRYAGEQNGFLAEDCVQNAVFNAWKRRLQFESVESLKSFLYISIKNEIVSLHRKAKASERYLSQLEDEVFFQNSVIDQEIELYWRVENYGYCWTIECVGEYGKEDESQSVGYFTGKVAEGVIFILFCFEKLISILSVKIFV